MPIRGAELQSVQIDGSALVPGDRAPPEEKPLAFPRTSETQSTGSGPPRRLAILDDDPVTCRTIAMMARRLGFDAKACATLDEFEAALTSFAPDVLLIDLMMPDIDGIDVVRRIGPLSKASLFVMSGADRRTFDASREVLASCGIHVAGFLHKPFGATVLAQAITGSATAATPLLAHTSKPGPRTTLSPAQFRHAVLSEKIEPHYQPIYYSDGRTLKGFEALARIQGDRAPGFSPDYLDQLAADDELAASLTDLVIQRALQFMSGLPGSAAALSISINLFGNYAVAEGFREWLVEQCARSGIARNRVILELSEATVFNFNDDDLRRVTQLRLAGFGLSIDDFGTGHSSLGRLARLPFSELKIDKVFSFALLHSQSAAAVIEACIGLAARLDMRVIAEGVENEEVAAVLASMGCDALQGHLFGQAMPADEVVRWLGASPPRAAA